jgi:Asp-tRNA(Asn)/Glu-tRNA(Gln) amidotransferase C subunit
MRSLWTPIRTPPSRDQVGWRFLSTLVADSKATATSKPSHPSDPSFPDPLNPTIPLSSVGLPLQPLHLPTSILHPPIVPISTTSLHTLHRLSAISPPSSHAEEERLKDGLGKLIGLMDGVKEVELGYETLEPVEGKRMIREDLVRGFWADPEDVFDGSDIEETTVELSNDMPMGRELLKWGRRVKDGQYVFNK